MKEYSKLLLTMARTRAEVVKDIYLEDKFLTKVMQRINEDIRAAIVFDEMRIDNEVPTEISVQNLSPASGS